jgi:hypothetical protein
MKFHPLGRPIALDGRLRTTISESRTNSLFFIVGRAKAGEEANLSIVYPRVSISTTITLPFLKCPWKCPLTDDATLTPPIMTNNEPIKKGIRLCVMEDANLVKYDEAQRKKASDDKLAAKGIKRKAGDADAANQPDAGAPTPAVPSASSGSGAAPEEAAPAAVADTGAKAKKGGKGKGKSKGVKSGRGKN